MIVESEADGNIRLRPAAVYRSEMYSEDRIAEFERENRLPVALRARAGKAINDRPKENK